MAHKAPAQPLVNNPPCTSVSPSGKVSSLDGAAVGTWVDLRTTIVDCRAMNLWPASLAGDDASLVSAAREGDRAAFGSLYARYARMVHGILLTRVPPGEVDDLVQDVFLRALPQLHALRDITRFGGWLATIARNRANDFHRHSRRADTKTQSLSEEETEVPAKGDAEQTQAEAILAIVQDLPEAYRETLILRLVEGMTGPEIAARTGLTHGSVRVNLHRGMQQLREKFGQDSRASAPLRDSHRNDRAPEQWNRAAQKRNDL